MTETAKERIDNEIKSVEKRLHSGRNAGKTYNIGVNEGLMIARAHVIDSASTDKLSVEKLQRENEIMKKALMEITYGEYNTFKLSAVPIAKQALAALEGVEDEL